MKVMGIVKNVIFRKKCNCMKGKIMNNNIDLVAPQTENF